MNKDQPIPNGATHYWGAAQDIKVLSIGTLRQLGYYRQIDGEWWVYSEVTNWRKSQNSPEWFEEETRLGHFKEI